MSTAEPPPLRIGNEERERAARAIAEHYAAGRLDPGEFEERTALAYAARTTADLDALFTDLPAPAAPPAHPTVAYPVPYPAPAASYPVEPAPYGREPATGRPYSDKSKVVAGVLQIVLPFGVGRFYTGHIGMGVAQLLLSVFFVGIVWAFLDGIVILAGRPTDPYGRPLRT